MNSQVVSDVLVISAVDDNDVAKIKISPIKTIKLTKILLITFDVVKVDAEIIIYVD